MLRLRWAAIACVVLSGCIAVSEDYPEPPQPVPMSGDLGQVSGTLEPGEQAAFVHQTGENVTYVTGSISGTDGIGTSPVLVTSTATNPEHQCETSASDDPCVEATVVEDVVEFAVGNPSDLPMSYTLRIRVTEAGTGSGGFGAN